MGRDPPYVVFFLIMVVDPVTFHRRSIRLKDYDYTSPGAYFVTVVTYKRACLFGMVVDGEMRLNEFGSIANDEWFHSSDLRPYIRLYPEEFVVMPNHIHGIIWIDEVENINCKGAASTAPLQRVPKQTIKFI